VLQIVFSFLIFNSLNFFPQLIPMNISGFQVAFYYGIFF